VTISENILTRKYKPYQAHYDPRKFQTSIY
jgi:hypothetical protein